MMAAVSVGVRALFALPLLGLQVVWILSPAPTVAKIMPGLLFLIGLWRPPVALVALAVLAPLSGILGIWTDLPFQGPRLFEQLVVAAVLAVLVRGLSWTTSRIAIPGMALIAIAVASALVTMPAWMLMHGAAATPATVWTALVQGDLFAITPAWQPAHAAVLITLGILLALAVESTIRKQPEIGHSLIVGLAAGATLAALLNLRRVLELADGRDALNVVGVVDLLSSVRLNTQFDINAAGSLFAMLILACASCLSRPGWYRWLNAGAMTTMAVGGLWLSGSRAAMAAALVGAVGALAIVALRARPEHRTRAAAGLIGLILVGSAAVAAYPATRNFAVSSSIDSRLILHRTALTMWRDTPVVGAGVGTFFTRSSDYGAAEVDKILVRGQARENAHNYFLQILAELGVIGLASYLVLLGSSLWFGRHSVWLVAGVVVFLATSLTGHPQLLSDAVMPFWMVLGVLSASASTPGNRSAQFQASIVATLTVVLVLTIPLRAGRVRDAIPLEHGGLGVSLWQTFDDGTRFRIANDRSAVFVPTGHTITVPVRLGAASSDSATVEVRVDGVVVNQLVLRADEWTPLRLSIRNARRRFVELRLKGSDGLTFWIGRADAKVPE